MKKFLIFAFVLLCFQSVEANYDYICFTEEGDGQWSECAEGGYGAWDQTTGCRIYTGTRTQGTEWIWGNTREGCSGRRGFRGANVRTDRGGNQLDILIRGADGQACYQGENGESFQVFDYNYDLDCVLEAYAAEPRVDDQDCRDEVGDNEAELIVCLVDELEELLAVDALLDIGGDNIPFQQEACQFEQCDDLPPFCGSTFRDPSEWHNADDFLGDDPLRCLLDETIGVGNGGVGPNPQSTQRHSALFDGDNSHFNKTFNTDGDRKTWTLALWVKTDNIGAARGAGDALFSTKSITNDTQGTFTIPGSGAFGDSRMDMPLYHVENVDPYQARTSQTITDTDWHHLMMVFDTTQANANNHITLYIDGTVAALDETNPAMQNYEGAINRAGVMHTIGDTYITFHNTGYQLEGIIDEMYFIDGQALDPSSFVSNGEAISYDGTYGANGFYLSFDDPNDLGNDSSGNGNHWTNTGVVPSNDVVTNEDLNNGGENPGGGCDEPICELERVELLSTATAAVNDQLQIQCPAGKKAISGGCFSGSHIKHIIHNYPMPGGDGWICNFNQDVPLAPDTNGGNGVYAVCGVVDASYEIVVNEGTVANTLNDVREVSCPAGKKLTGGGCATGSGSYDILHAYPTDGGDAFHCNLNQDDGTTLNGNGFYNAYAICTDPISQYEIVNNQETTTAAVNNQSEVDCPGTKTLLGGGCFNGSSNFALGHFIPDDALIGFNCSYNQDSPATPNAGMGLTSYAICAEITNNGGGNGGGFPGCIDNFDTEDQPAGCDPNSVGVNDTLDPVHDDICRMEVCDFAGNCSICEPSPPLKYDATDPCTGANGGLGKTADGALCGECAPGDDDCHCVRGDASRCRDNGPVNCYTNPFDDRCPGFQNPACLADPFTPGCPVVNPCYPTPVYDGLNCPLDAVRFCARNPYHYGCNVACSDGSIDCDPLPPTGN